MQITLPNVTYVLNIQLITCPAREPFIQPSRLFLRTLVYGEDEVEKNIKQETNRDYSRLVTCCATDYK